MQAEDDLVHLKGGDHLLLGVHHLELDVARDGVGQVEEGGDGRPDLQPTLTNWATTAMLCGDAAAVCDDPALS